MNETEIIETARQALLITIEIGAPTLIIGLLVGVLIALVQALTQIQKILAILLALFFFLPSMMQTLVVFTESLADRMIGLG
jgi:flagellar biosynthetic protein FliQ